MVPMPAGPEVVAEEFALFRKYQVLNHGDAPDDVRAPTPFLSAHHPRFRAAPEADSPVVTCSLSGGVAPSGVRSLLLALSSSLTWSLGAAPGCRVAGAPGTAQAGACMRGVGHGHGVTVLCVRGGGARSSRAALCASSWTPPWRPRRTSRSPAAAARRPRVRAARTTSSTGSMVRHLGSLFSQRNTLCGAPSKA